MLAVFASLLLLQLPAAPAPVKPVAKDPLLRRAAALFETLDIEGARKAYEQAVSVRLASSDELVEAYLGVGLCAATLGDEPGAKQAFLSALAIKADARLDAADISPRQRAPFDAARAEARGRPSIRVDHTPPPSWLPGAPGHLKVEVANDWSAQVSGVRVAFRREGAGQSFDEVTASGASPYELTVPPLGSGAVEYYLQAIDAHGSPLAQWKSAEAPHLLRVEEVAATPLYKKPWLWAVVGGVVAASVAASVAVAVTRDPDYQVQTRPAP